MDHHKKYFHLYLISDSTGETLIAASRATAAQFGTIQALEHLHPLIRSQKQLQSVLDTVDQAPGIVLYTIVDKELSDSIKTRCMEIGVPCVSLLEQVFNVFQSYLGTPSRERSGAQHVLDADYFKRIDALTFTMEHDDGQLPENIEEADVILVGISRTSKTPTSVYLANRGVKTTNIPIVLNLPLPNSIYQAERPLIVGLIATTDRICEVRKNRMLGSTFGYDGEQYTDRSTIAEELKYAKMLCSRNNWPLIDVTRKSIEETAAGIIALLSTKKNERN